MPRRELLDYVNDRLEERYGHRRMTGRTLERDIADIDELFSIGILFNHTRQDYFIMENYGDYDERVCELMMGFRPTQRPRPRLEPLGICAGRAPRSVLLRMTHAAYQGHSRQASRNVPITWATAKAVMRSVSACCPIT